MSEIDSAYANVISLVSLAQKCAAEKNLSYVKESKTDNNNDSYGAKVYAKVYAGKKLTPEEVQYLAKNNPSLYATYLRAQIKRKAVEAKLKSCQSKKQVDEVETFELAHISKDDPDREIMMNTVKDAIKEFKQSDNYKNLPYKTQEEKQSSNLLNNSKADGTASDIDSEDESYTYSCSLGSYHEVLQITGAGGNGIEVAG